MKLSILFESPFWIALLEKESDGLLYAARHVFGSEPSSENVYEFILSGEYKNLVEGMTVGLLNKRSRQRSINPKRLQRQIRQEKERSGISNQSREVMRLQQEQNKKERASTSKEERERKRNYKRELATNKRKQKHRGR
ncbi:YjdF family protein [Pleurocapsa sp. FMAR1]|uniref:YjdF family protein n=1 Tax=Pleurocapsa sp. FMAR1 TaxID=3040204 RepID=UPI0029C8BFD1|nr:YjdF family protein [Pleurocapsa sp. FMAR1]